MKHVLKSNVRPWTFLHRETPVLPDQQKTSIYGLGAGTGCSLEDLTETMDGRDGERRERKREKMRE